MFPEPPRVPHSLSKGYAGEEYRRGKVTWSQYRTRSGKWCDECFMLQHEGRHEGLVRVRAYSTRKRVTSTGATLYLCGPHAHLWKERDEEVG